MGRHVAGECPQLDRLVDEACASIGSEVAAMKTPRLAGVVLGGGYGRGEGGAREKSESKVGVGERNNSAPQLKSPTPTLALSNDLDFFAITESGVHEAEAVAEIAAALEPVSKKWTAELGVDVDFAVKTPWRLKHDEERLMVQELLRGHFDVAGRKGEELFAGIRSVDAAELPWSEAVRLLMNRGMGLLLAKESTERDFIDRNINKCVLGAGDARLIAKGAYRWKAEDRAAALGDALYSAAVDWKFRPRAEPVCDWETARGVWLAALEVVSRCPRAAGRSRNLRNAARWLARRHSLGELRTFALDPVVRVIETVARHVREGRKASDSLMRDWKVFN